MIKFRYKRKETETSGPNSNVNNKENNNLIKCVNTKPITSSTTSGINKKINKVTAQETSELNSCFKAVIVSY